MIATSAPFSQYFDKNGDPLDSGYVYFGVPDANPETSPIPAYWDEAGTQPVAQPARTLAGYIVRNGTPARVYVEGAYSQTVKNKRGELVYYAANSEDYSNLPVNVATIEATDGQTNVNLPFSYTRGNNSLSVYLNGSLLLKDRDYIETSDTSFQMLYPLKVGPGGADEVTAIGGRLINPSSAVGTVSAAALAAGSGAGLVGYDSALTFPVDTVGERLQRTTFTVDAITSVDATALGLVDGDVVVAKGRTTATDGGGGTFRYDSASAQATDGGLVFAPTAGGGRLFRNGWTSTGFNGEILDSWFGLTSGMANASTEFAAFLAASTLGTQGVLQNTYLIDPISVDYPVNVYCKIGAGIKRREAVNAASNLIEFVAGSEGSRWMWGTADGNRAALKATYDGYGTSPVWNEFAVLTDNISVSGLSVRDGIYGGFYADQSDDSEFIGIKTYNCTANQVLRCSRTKIAGFIANDSDNDGSAVDVRGLTINTLTNCSISGVEIYGCTGDTAVPSSTDAITGIVALDLVNCDIDGLTVRDMEGADVLHLAISLVRVLRSRIRNVEAYSFAGTGLECIDCSGTTIDGFLIDALFQESTLRTEATNAGMVIHSEPYYPLGQRTRRAVKTSQTLLMSNGFVQRCGVGINTRSSLVTFDSVVSSGNVTQNWKVETIGTASSFAGAPDSVPHRVKLIDCQGNNAGNEGLSLRGGDDVQIFGGEFSNNGQNTATSTTLRIGIGYAGSATLNRLTIQAPLACDTQTYTVTDGLTFQPGTATQSWPNNDKYCYTVTLLGAQKVEVGQYLSLVNATGAGNLTGYVMDIERDEAILGFTTAVVFSSTGNTTALAGTWSGSGTTLTGTGTSGLTEVDGPYWLTDGTEWRQATSCYADDTITIRTPFTTPLSGASLSKLETDYSGIPSQQTGVRLLTANIASLYHDGIIAYGNVSTQLTLGSSALIAGANKTRAGSFVGQTMTIADDAVATITPPVTQGMVIVSDNLNTGGAVVYRATASPLTNLVAGSASTFAVTTGTLTGTTGADGVMTVSALTDGTIQIENRRGASRNVDVLFVARE